MAWRSQHPDPPQSPPSPRESPHAIAWAALLFSLIACGLAGFSFLSTYKGGEYGDRLKEGVEVFRGEARKWIDKGEVKVSGDPDEATEAAAGAAKGGAAGSGAAIPWDRLREKVAEARDLIAVGDESAKGYLEDLSDEIARLRRSAGEAKDDALDSAAKAVQEAQATFDDGTTKAADKLKNLQLDLAPKVRALLDRKDAATPAPESPGRSEGE